MEKLCQRRKAEEDWGKEFCEAGREMSRFGNQLPQTGPGLLPGSNQAESGEHFGENVMLCRLAGLKRKGLRNVLKCMNP